MQFLTILLKNSKKLLLSLFISGGMHFACAKGLPAEFYSIKDNDLAKSYFLEHLYELIEQENIAILKEREFVIDVLNNRFLELQKDSQLLERLVEIKQKYQINNIYSLEEYLKKIDVIPPSLALAQAAVESAWGKSRFIKEANNIFGHWTYEKEIGIVPKKRALGASHFIRIFDSLEASIKAYMLNLNRNVAYKSFQEQRYIKKEENMQISGLDLSKTMINYSGIANKYLDILKSVILGNNLQEFDYRYFSRNEELNKTSLVLTAAL
ncbi:glucosaminidase domain-containing protein [Arcobacter vandammei]|uniref:glucosaminidase domain-containing protein n=1 Tax=Arcobacter vandammei TaxID=2782243 RepID=UPI0018DFB1CC|nr:glucosaminidase domain-containing protein [Arcobacter vandammei]